MTLVRVAIALGFVAIASIVAHAEQEKTPGADASAAPAGRGNQTPAARGAKPPSGAQTPTVSATQQLIDPPGFTYNPEGRRDPFVSLLRSGGSVAGGGGTGTRPTGLPGLAVAEVTLRGTLRGREGFVGILQGADQKTYIVRAGDRLFDGTVRTVTQNDMVIVQQVNDPLSLEKQREVRKVLRQVEAN
jgi:Tfp pilus assembly protein PilP